jgi:hypothetical protein
VRILFTVSPRFPPQGKSAEGEAGPKARPKGVVDGQLVNIPALPKRCPRRTHIDNGVEPEAGPSTGRDCSLEREDVPTFGGKSLELYKPVKSVPRKVRREITFSETVLITDTGRRGE